MLEYREGAEVYNIARIKSDPEDEKILIAVSGRESTRRSFLSMIRDTFTKIHNSFANLEISQWVPVPGYPDGDPLDYEELQGLEEMGESTVRVGKLKLRLDLHQLLDGYEVRENRNYIIPNTEELKESNIEINIFSEAEKFKEDSDVKSDGIGFMAKIKQLLGI